MQIITTREFRTHQKKYFELAEKEPVIIARKSGRPISIHAVTDEDIPTPSELASIRRGVDDVKNGLTYEMRQDESLDEFLNRVESCIK